MVRPRLLRRGKHTVAHLTPLPLVAKFRADDPEAVGDLSRELRVAHHLAARHAPTARAASTHGAKPHVQGGYAITLWDLVEHSPSRRSDVAAAADALKRVHAALLDYDAPLPLLRDRVRACGDLIARPASTPCLPDDDRFFLAALHARLLSDLGEHSCEVVPLRGDPHLGNALITDAGAVWSDFEAACLGPREWDIACLPERAWGWFDDASASSLRLLAELRSLCVAAWCWSDYGKSPRVDEAAHYHLALLRTRDRR